MPHDLSMRLTIRCSPALRGRTDSSTRVMKSTLKKQLADWTDFDAAGLHLGRCLGLFDGQDRAKTKHVFWSAHPVGESLVSFLDQLVSVGVLEHDPEHMRYRWNASFKGSWEK